MSLSPPSSTSPYAPWLRELKSDERGLYLIHLLLNCATHVSSGNLDQANAFLDHISLLSSPDGDAMQRIASYFTESLARRLLLRSFPGLYRALNASSSSSSPITSTTSFSARRHFLDLCPFLRLAFVVSNQSIIEAMEGEKVIHVVDLDASDPTQMLDLLRLLASRPEGPPHLRITGVHDNKQLLTHTAMCLTKEAERLDIPFQFNPVVCRLDCLNIEDLGVKTGEALAINCVLQLHRLLHSDQDKPSARNVLVEMLEKERSPESTTESFLAALWGLSPKVMVVTEQESNHNGPTLNERFIEALNFYAALFDCLESTVPRQSAERGRVERMLFGEEIKNIISCEGAERRERHEKLERWARRIETAGFAKLPLSYYALLQGRRLLQGFACDGYKVKEENGCFLICWQDRSLFTISAWRCRRLLSSSRMATETKPAAAEGAKIDPFEGKDEPEIDQDEIWDDASDDGLNRASGLSREWQWRHNQFHTRERKLLRKRDSMLGLSNLCTLVTSGALLGALQVH
ncbi:scarecrow-like protein 3 isoform X2 [Typha latifolia]|uniref:scarecrow-like protein 3 isoform X2 n=1 Tax=Typha latifolia TaxID=4733 RepID=UPI003C2BDBE7